jgi:acetyl-CoA carboxylase alpha subunit
VPEPEGGAHRDHESTANLLDVSLQKHQAELKKLAPAE